MSIVTDMLKSDLWQLRPALLNAVFNPGHYSIKHLLLTPNIELITGDDVDQLVGWQQHELFTLHHLKGRNYNNKNKYI